MTPLALWTGRLPGLRPLPQPWTFWATGGVVALGAAGAFGLLGVEGPWLGIVGSFAAGWTLWRHRWPGRPPVGLKPLEAPQGADERTVVVEFRHEGVLLGWDVGILWFERGGVGFVGRTVSFVLPRALMHTSPWSPFADTALRAPRFVAEVYGTALAFVPVARESHAHMTLARIDALPEEITSETVLPPSSLHPDLLARGLAVRRRMPVLSAIYLIGYGTIGVSTLFHGPSPTPGFALFRGVLFLFSIILVAVVHPVPLPQSILARLPKESRRRRGLM